jgi:hypothetical protein
VPEQPAADAEKLADPVRDGPAPDAVAHPPMLLALSAVQVLCTRDGAPSAEQSCEAVAQQAAALMEAQYAQALLAPKKAPEKPGAVSAELAVLVERAALSLQPAHAAASMALAQASTARLP